MLRAPEIESVSPGIFLWRLYDPAIKADLFSTGLKTDSGSYLIDPIQLQPEAAGFLGAVAGIIVTNENHSRASTDFAAKFRVPIYSAATTHFAAGLEAIPIEGAAAGEIAVYSPIEGGTVVMGDALINFDPYGFTFLPAKYCSSSKVMRKSLEKLLDYSFERMLFAHGTPILSRPRERLETLLRSNR